MPKVTKTCRFAFALSPCETIATQQQHGLSWECYFFSRPQHDSGGLYRSPPLPSASALPSSTSQLGKISIYFFVMPQQQQLEEEKEEDKKKMRQMDIR